jgi:hypothetical protein
MIVPAFPPLVYFIWAMLAGAPPDAAASVLAYDYWGFLPVLAEFTGPRYRRFMEPDRGNLPQR